MAPAADLFMELGRIRGSEEESRAFLSNVGNTYLVH